MSVYGEALRALRSVVVIDERLKALAGRVDLLGDEVRDLKERLIRLETVVELVKSDGMTLRIARRADRE